ncbi:MAG: hypothetical protein INR71_04115 [Terriglobus roseus]|nr:hypothetical protein [Terriglobus roseus]
MNHQQHMHMAAMAAGGGPVGGAQLMNAGARGGGGGMQPSQSLLIKLNTYIYDYLIRHGFHDVARAMHKASKLSDNPMPILLGDGSSPAGRDMNGVDGVDMKEEVKRPSDLPEPGNKIGAAENCFLEDWWCQFWDLHVGARGQGNGALMTYINASQVRV